MGHVNTLAATPGTHTHASVEAWDWPATYAEISTILQAMKVVNFIRDQDVTPIRLPFPWRDADAVTPEERLVAEAELERRSALRS
jgi:phytoene/squalene synthetase